MKMVMRKNSEEYAMKKNYLLVLPIIMLVLMACSFGNYQFHIGSDFQRIEGSGNVIEESRNVQGFNEISLRGFGDLIIEQGDKESLVVEAEDNLLAYIDTEVRGSTLIIDMEDGISFDSTEPIRYYLTVKDLREISISGFGNVDLDNLSTDSLDLRLSGSGDITIDELIADTLNLNISGFGSADVAGVVDAINVRISGSGDFNAFDLETNVAEIKITGFGNAKVWVLESLDINISGSGNLDYYGSPSVSQSITGFGGLESFGEK
jgi:hypothetical protein